jgi:hypothetical protein
MQMFPEYAEFIGMWMENLSKARQLPVAYLIFKSR